RGARRGRARAPGARARGARRVLRARAIPAARRRAVRACAGAGVTVIPAAAPAYTLAEARDPAAVARALAARGVALEPDEVQRLPRLLGRAPLWAEVVLFGILWSEHCSY